MLKAPVAEIFASYQGEGLYAGQPQVFIRFAGCNMRCSYCDTPAAVHLKPHQEFISVDSIVQKVKKLAAKGIDEAAASRPVAVSLTGGEPLLYPEALAELLPALKKLKLKVHLETNGTLPEYLKKVKRWVDVVAMDIKAPSDCREAHWREHKDFLALCRKQAFAKMVLTDITADADVNKAVALVAAAGKDIPFILQPATPFDGTGTVAPWKLAVLAATARKKLKSVHIQPQLHKIWKVT